MITVTQSQMIGLERERFLALSLRIDEWLSTEILDWGEQTRTDRLDWIGDVLAFGHQHGMRSDMNFALLASVFADHRSDWREFAAEMKPNAVLTCKVRQPGAKLRELSRLSDDHPTRQSAHSASPNYESQKSRPLW